MKHNQDVKTSNVPKIPTQQLLASFSCSLYLQPWSTGSIFKEMHAHVYLINLFALFFLKHEVIIVLFGGCWEAKTFHRSKRN